MSCMAVVVHLFPCIRCCLEAYYDLLTFPVVQYGMSFAAPAVAAVSGWRDIQLIAGGAAIGAAAGVLAHVATFKEDSVTVPTGGEAQQRALTSSTSQFPWTRPLASSTLFQYTPR